MFKKGEILIYKSYRGTVKIVEFIKYDNKEKDSFTAKVLISNRYKFEEKKIFDNFAPEAFNKASLQNVPKEFLTQELIELIKNKNISIIKELLENKIILKNLCDEEKYKTILNIYNEMLEYIYIENNINIEYKIDTFLEDISTIKTNTNVEALKNIRDNILNKIKKEINYLIGEEY